MIEDSNGYFFCSFCLRTYLAGRLGNGDWQFTGLFTCSTNTVFIGSTGPFCRGNALCSLWKSSPGPGFACLGFRKTGAPGRRWAFFAGILVIALIDRLVPAGDNPHVIKRWKNSTKNTPKPPNDACRYFSALAIAIHNFPEGQPHLSLQSASLRLALP